MSTRTNADLISEAHLQHCCSIMRGAVALCIENKRISEGSASRAPSVQSANDQQNQPPAARPTALLLSRSLKFLRKRPVSAPEFRGAIFVHRVFSWWPEVAWLVVPILIIRRGASGGRCMSRRGAAAACRGAYPYIFFMVFSRYVYSGAVASHSAR